MAKGLFKLAVPEMTWVCFFIVLFYGSIPQSDIRLERIGVGRGHTFVIEGWRTCLQRLTVSMRTGMHPCMCMPWWAHSCVHVVGRRRSASRRRYGLGRMTLRDRP